MKIEQALQLLRKTNVSHDELSKWPPDVFAVCAWLLLKSGAYKNIVIGHVWHARKAPEKWQKQIEQHAKEWRKKPTAPPAWVKDRWDRLATAGTRSIIEIVTDEQLCGDVLDLVAVCDETCVGIGISDTDTVDDFISEAAGLLVQRNFGGKKDKLPSSLTKNIDPEIIFVLPKLHTPNCGITLRSLTHHLALVESGEIKPIWYWASPITEDRHGLNILLIPWPEVISPHQFQPAAGDQDGRHSDIPEFGFFDFTPQNTREWPFEKFDKVLKEAKTLARRVDMVVLPEASLPDTQTFDLLNDAVRKVFPEAVFMAGVVDATPTGTSNIIRSTLVGSIGGEPYTAVLNQAKHHRWKLERNQILQYQLAASLDPSKEWWEAIDISKRELYFYNFCSWFTLCGLICEDLARQDPVANVIRAVGPNLLIALLMDAPQLKSRWPARYATVFADDPGTSVLTCTSLGMASLSRPVDLPPDTVKSRVVALWKDMRGHPKEISLTEKASAAVLTLVRTRSKEITADGRDDQDGSYFLELVHIDQVCVS